AAPKEQQKAQKPEKEEPKKEQAAAAQKEKEQKPEKEQAAAAQQEKEQKPEKEPEKEEPKQKEEAPQKEEEKKDTEDTDFIKTKVEKLKGPNIVGSIELPEKQKRHEKKKPDQKRRDRNKKPAESKGKAKETDSQKKKPVASSTDDNVRPKKKKRRRIATGSETTQNKQDASQRPQKGAKPAKKTTSKKPAARRRHEPSEEEVQKQVKETLARLSGGGKSKSSKHRRSKRDTVKTQQESEGNNQEKKVLQATEFVTVNELATMMEVNVNQVISTCMSLGLFVSINQRLDAETINMVADEFGYDVEFVSVEVQEALESHEKDEEEGEQVERAPIVTVMGHVDHGKTSLLDFIRKTNVIGGEAGGITQHIGAYEVKTQSGKRITFLDTPGHEAFTAMRARGAQVTDVAIIIIAADDKIMPQTIEAINHAQAAGVPTVFAINKVDKPGASPDKIKEELSQRNILVEEWGGKYQSQDISALKGEGIEELLEKVLLESELLELKGSPEKMARGTVIESALDRGRGYIAKLLVQDGTLHKGDYVLAGAHSGKVKAMYNERNQVVDEAGPSSPVLMLGLDGAPQAGDQFNVLKDEREAKEIALKRRQLQREQGIRTQKHVTLDEIGRRIAIGDFKELNVIVKGDVDGSVEALADSLLKQTTDEVQLNVIHKSVGQISESDVMLASASDAIIVGFQVRPSLAARRLAEREQIDIRVYSVIYKAIEEIKSAMEGMLSPEIEEKIVCNLEVRETFKITKVGTIAGCKVLDGVITRNTKVRVIRDGIVIYTGTLGSLKRFKDDVREVKAGYECGLNIDNFNDIKVGDIIEGYEQVEVARKL
ncbi:MAG: translation initiation factor IF-2, partial [Bacteroidota bacterium]